MASLRQRAQGTTTALRAAVDGLGATDRNTLLGTLDVLADFAIPDCLADVDAPDEVLRQRASDARAAAQARLDALDAILEPAAEATDEEAVAVLRQRIEVAFGGTLRVLAPFAVPNGTELAASRAQSVALQDDDPTQASGWLARCGLVRDGAERLARLLLLAETLAGNTSDALRVVQLPHADGARWIGLDFPDDSVPPSTSAIVLHDPDAVDFATSLCGLVVDDWTEVVPRGSEITGVSFHFDQPDATAPNVIAIGVHPGDRPTWDLETMEATVLEVLALAKLRAVDTDDVQWVGRFLPLLYFPDNLAGDTAAVDWTVMATAVRET
jgi:hypothetical protein